MNINWIEAVWLVICTTGIVATAVLLADTFGERTLVNTLVNGRREIRATIVFGNIRRETLRLLMQVILLLFVLPGLFEPGEVNFNLDLQTFFILCLMSMPILLLMTSFFDKRERRILRELALQVVQEEKVVTNDAIVAALAEHDENVVENTKEITAKLDNINDSIRDS